MALNRAERRRAERERKKAAAKKDPDALFAEALAHHEEGRVEETLRLAEQALVQDPTHGHALLLAGMASIQSGDAGKALGYLADKTRLDPENPHGHVSHGAALMMAGELEAALDCFRRAIALDPDMEEAHSNLGVALRDLSRLAEAETAMRKALTLVSGDARLTVSLATVVQARGRIDEAIDIYDSALALRPGHADTLYKRCLCYFAEGDFVRAQADYESRWRAETFDSKSRDLPQPRWNGENLAGKSLHIWAEQGVGDHIIYAGVLASLAADGAACIFECDRRLAPLFARSLPGVRVVATDQSPTPEADFQIPAASLTLDRRIRTPSLYPRDRYLEPDPDRLAPIKKRLAEAAHGRPRIGISWRSSRIKAGPWKSMPLDLWGPILADRDALFVNLQYGDTDEEIADAHRASGADIYTDAEIDRFNDFEGLAALVDCLDLVITTSNVTAHIAGALGKPCLLALQKTPLWYWGTPDMPTPLYRSVERFWQSTENQWRDVIDQIAARRRRPPVQGE